MPSREESTGRSKKLSVTSNRDKKKHPVSSSRLSQPKKVENLHHSTDNGLKTVTNDHLSPEQGVSQLEGTKLNFVDVKNLVQVSGNGPVNVTYNYLVKNHYSRSKPRDHRRRNSEQPTQKFETKDLGNTYSNDFAGVMPGRSTSSIAWSVASLFTKIATEEAKDTIRNWTPASQVKSATPGHKFRSESSPLSTPDSGYGDSIHSPSAGRSRRTRSNKTHDDKNATSRRKIAEG